MVHYFVNQSITLPLQPELKIRISYLFFNQFTSKKI